MLRVVRLVDEDALRDAVKRRFKSCPILWTFERGVDAVSDRSGIETERLDLGRSENPPSPSFIGV